jgi:hypothetical protein
MFDQCGKVPLPKTYDLIYVPEAECSGHLRVEVAE